ncbi:MAG: YlxR family protein [Fimbriimonadaceae bacterium]
MENRHPQRRTSESRKSRCQSRRRHELIANPVRTCISCRVRKPQIELLRFNFKPSGVLNINPRQPFGRSFYICKNPKCLSQANPGAASRVLKKQVPAETLATAIQNPVCQQR